MKLSYKRIMSAIFALVVAMTFMLPQTLEADETVIKLDRDQVGQMAVGNSGAIRSVKATQSSFARQYSDMRDGLEERETLYDGLKDYQGIYTIYQSARTAAGTPANYDKYITFANSNVVIENEQAARMIDEVDTDEVDGEPAFLMDNAAELLLKNALSEKMSLVAYNTQFLPLYTAYIKIGIINPNLSKAEEYAMFVNPLSVGTYALQTAVANMNYTVESTEVAIASGAKSLYDVLLMFEGFLELQEKNYDVALLDYNSALMRHENGQISDVDFTIAKNEEEIARRNRDSMLRDVENTMMSLNIMLGQDIQAKLELSTDIAEVVQLEPMAYYIERALVERSEILTLKNSYSQKKSEFEYIDEFFSSSSSNYKIAEYDLDILDIDQEDTNFIVEVNVRQAYLNVLEKQENLQVKSLAMEDSNNTYNKLKLNYELGFITQSMLSGIEIMKTQSTNDYFTAYRDYLTAVSALENASSIGPGYGGTGGMTFE